jgi:hypothetical protein
MTKAAQTIMPKMCHDRFAPSAKIDNTGRAKKNRHNSRDQLEVSLASLFFATTHKDPNRKDPKSPSSRSFYDPNRIRNHT